MKFTRACLVVLAVIMLSSALSTAQVNWMSPLHEPGISLEISKVSYEWDRNLSFWSIQYSLSGRIRLADRLDLLLEFPYSHFSRKAYSYYGGSYYERSESTIGNPLLGIELAGRESSPVLKFGVRLPLAEVDYQNYHASDFGMASAMDRWEAFWPKLLTLQLSTGYRVVEMNQYQFQFLFSPTAMFPDEGDPELLADCSAEFWLTQRYVRAGLGINGRLIVTESDLSFDERTQFQAGASLSATIGSFHPGIHIRVPLDESIQQSLNFTYGLNLTVDLPVSNSTGEGE